MSQESVSKAQRQWRGFLERAPPYPSTMHGRGIVICGGGLKYIVPAWVNVQMIRRSGCTLPIEMWYEESPVFSL